MDGDLVDLYGRLAPSYDRLHQRWLKYAGGQAQVALEATARVLATPQASLLDAGCGTGAFARSLVAEGISPKRITLLDPSDAMLDRCSDLPVRRVKGRLEALPFQDGAFDIATCAWALETSPNLEIALRELTRVVAPGGVLGLAFCSWSPAGAPAAWLMRQAILWRGTGRFLPVNKVVEILRQSGTFDVRIIPSKGPAAALVARRVRH
jgi:ubiquinone/menaquinone biosynthesis C-methylase UbiE